MNYFNLRFAIFWLHYICVFVWLWLCLTENFLLVSNLLGHTATAETAFPTFFEKIIVAMAENCENCLLSCDWRWLSICGHICSEQWICRCTSRYVPSCVSLIAIISERHVFQGSKWSERQALPNKRGKTEKKKQKRKRNEVKKTIKMTIDKNLLASISTILCDGMVVETSSVKWGGRNKVSPSISPT